VREKVPKADEGMLGRASQACPHPTLSRKRERGKAEQERKKKRTFLYICGF